MAEFLLGAVAVIIALAMLCGAAIWHTQTCKRGDN